ncbi:MAG: ParB/RepB/Spo0J family partition protein [Candidatus Hydrogenedentes bacterium]|nr:ParB/RepB/Spo0J family partition protein [Candidatus Hydrogenedentota bacterium]
MAKKKKGLGRGLGALISTNGEGGFVGTLDEQTSEEATARVLLLDPRNIKPNPKQPRVHFDEESLEELSESIRRDGLQEPVIVRKAGETYELVSGERRVRAAVMADLETIPAICRKISDSDMLRLGLIENIQREDLNPIELAHAYKQLIEEFHWTQEQLAEQVGKKRATVTNILRLLNLPEAVQACVADGSIAMGHARALLGIESPQKQLSICRKIVNEGFSVRHVEKITSRGGATPKPKVPKDPNMAAIEDELRRKLSTKVALKASSNTKGKIEIEYFNLDELDRLLELIRSIR